MTAEGEGVVGKTEDGRKRREICSRLGAQGGLNVTVHSASAHRIRHRRTGAWCVKGGPWRGSVDGGANVEDKRDYTRACFPASFASFASFASRRRVDLCSVRVSVNQLVGATLYATHTYVRLFRYRRFCADDLDETLFGGSEENDGDAVHAQQMSSSGIAHIVTGGKRPPRVHWAPLAVLSLGPRLAGALSRGSQVLRAIPLEIGEHRAEIVVGQMGGSPTGFCWLLWCTPI